MSCSCCRITDLRDKDVICIRDGTNLGNVCDVEVDTCSGKLVSIVVYGRSKLFGILGREDDFVVDWSQIEIIGEDAILVNCEPPRPRKRGKTGGLFGSGGSC